MKTATHTPFTRNRVLRHAATALLLAGLAALTASAVNPPANVPAPAAPSAVAIDPYLAYLESLDTRSASCLEHSFALRALLAERERLAYTFLQATPTGRADLTRAMEALDQRIEAAETALETSVAATEPGDAPNLAPPPEVDIEAIRAQSQRWRKPMYLPLPPPLVIPELPAPTSEALYLDYLTVRAGDSKFAQDLVANVTTLLHERRELAYRHAHSRAHERARIEGTLRAISLQVRTSAGAIAEGATVSGW
jgi:hypothetical protein